MGHLPLSAADVAEFKRLLADASPGLRVDRGDLRCGSMTLHLKCEKGESCNKSNWDLAVALFAYAGRLIATAEAHVAAQAGARETIARALHDVRARWHRDGTAITAEQYRDADAVLAALFPAQPSPAPVQG